jgi:outer membrane lipoprotein-sorting protein
MGPCLPDGRLSGLKRLKMWSFRNLKKLGRYAQSAANLTLSCKIHAAKATTALAQEAAEVMVQDQKVFKFLKATRVLSLCAASVLMACGPALAQGGQTEVAKTTPSLPPPQAPVQPVQPAAPAPKAAAANPQWQTNLGQPPQPPQETDAQIVTKVNDYFNKLTDLQGTFIQTDPDTRQKAGRFYFQRPGKIRFDYAPPSKLRIISDGRNLSIEDRDMNTSERYPLDVTPFRLLLSETVDLANDAKILGVEQGPDTVVLTVEDKNGDSSGRIRLLFNRADMTLREWIITDAQGLDTRIQVSDLEQNKKVAENFFLISAFTLDHDR